MDKLEWLKHRKSQELPISICWEYYNEIAPPHFNKYTLEEFGYNYAQYMANCSMIPCLDTKGAPKKFDFNKVIKLVHEHFDKKFQIE